MTTQRERILAAQDVQVEVVHVPQWGEDVRVRGMTGTQRDAFEASVVVQQPNGNRRQRRNGQSEAQVNIDNIRARLCAWCIVDEDGNRVFSDDDIPALGEKSGAALDPIFEAAMRLSGISGTDVDGMAEAMLENPSGGSSSP